MTPTDDADADRSTDDLDDLDGEMEAALARAIAANVELTQMLDRYDDGGHVQDAGVAGLIDGCRRQVFNSTRQYIELGGRLPDSVDPMSRTPADVTEWEESHTL